MRQCFLTMLSNAVLLLHMVLFSALISKMWSCLALFAPNVNSSLNAEAYRQTGLLQKRTFLISLRLCMRCDDVEY